MNRFFVLAFLLITMILTINGKEPAPSETVIYLVSKNGDKVGNNGTYTFDEENGSFQVKMIKPAISATPKGFSIIFYHAYEDSWQFKFVVPSQKQVVKGKLYKDAYNYPYQYQDQAGIKACRIQQDFLDLRGEFKVLKYKIDTKGVVTSLAIDFKQISDDKGVLYGSIRYKSKLPVTKNFN